MFFDIQLLETNTESSAEQNQLQALNSTSFQCCLETARKMNEVSSSLNGFVRAMHSMNEYQRETRDLSMYIYEGEVRSANPSNFGRFIQWNGLTFIGYFQPETDEDPDF